MSNDLLLGPKGQAFPSKTRPRVLAILPHVIPSTTIGVIKPMKALHRQGKIFARFMIESMTSWREVEAADVIVFCRNTEPRYARGLDYARQLAKPIIYELDDNLFALPAESEVGQYHRDPSRLNQLTEYIQAAALVRVYSSTLARRIAELNPNVVQVEGPIDWSLVSPSPNLAKAPDEVWIVYTTSRITDRLADIFLDDVEQVLARYGDGVKLFLWGYRSSRLQQGPQVRFLDYVTSYNRFFRLFSAYGFDIGLAPLQNDVFHLSKSNNKFREYAAAGIAGIYSNVTTYAECVEHGVTGLLVENQPGAWFRALADLIDDADRRRKIQAQARAYARQHYDQDKFCNVWWEHLVSVLAQAQRVETPKSIPARTAAGKPIGRHGIFHRLSELVLRFFRRLRTDGLRTALAMARWTLNDLSLVFWNLLNK